MTEQFVYFGLYFLTFFFELVYWSLLGWVILTWLLMFGAMKPSNRIFQFLNQLVDPLLKPFRWARLGGIDFSPIVAIVVLNVLVNLLRQGLLGLA